MHACLKGEFTHSLAYLGANWVTEILILQCLAMSKFDVGSSDKIARMRRFYVVFNSRLSKKYQNLKLAYF